tara:strand:+ start:225 stop:452 length:228 start_codon:yes stop_codon:yes gene_type:complete
LIGAFALAQYYMGIGITIEVKEKHVGKRCLTECSDNELKTIINELRRTYEKRNRSNKNRNRPGDGTDKKVVRESK